MKPVSPRALHPGAPCAARTVVKHLRSDDVRADALAGSVDGAVGMRLGGKVHYGVHVAGPEDARDLALVADVDPLERDLFLVEEAPDVVGGAGIRQRVDDDNGVLRMALRPEPGEVRADESGAASDHQASGHQSRPRDRSSSSIARRLARQWAAGSPSSCSVCHFARTAKLGRATLLGKSAVRTGTTFGVRSSSPSERASSPMATA